MNPVFPANSQPSLGRSRHSFLLGLAIILGSALESADLVYGYVTFEAPAESERVFGLPLEPPTAFSGEIAEAELVDPEEDLGRLVFAGTPFTPDAFDETGEPAYVRIRSGARAGFWYHIIGNSADTLIVDTVGDEGASGFPALAAGDAVAIHRYHTLGGLFPDGAPLTASSDPFTPNGDLVLLFGADTFAMGINRFPNRGYFYYNGAIGIFPAGWYAVGNPGAGLQDGLPLFPEASIRLRVRSQPATITVSGEVPNEARRQLLFAPEAGSAQDNPLVNPFPLDLAFDDMDLTESGRFAASDDPFAPEGDLLLIFDSASTGYNLAPSRAYFYYSGAAGIFPAGWKRVGQLGSEPAPNHLSVPPGAAFIIRKRSADAGDSLWLAPLPYSLD